MYKIALIIVFTAFYFSVSAQSNSNTETNTEYFYKPVKFDQVFLLPYGQSSQLKLNLNFKDAERLTSSAINTNQPPSPRAAFFYQVTEVDNVIEDERQLFLEASDPNRVYSLIKESY